MKRCKRPPRGAGSGPWRHIPFPQPSPPEMTAFAQAALTLEGPRQHQSRKSRESRWGRAGVPGQDARPAPLSPRGFRPSTHTAHVGFK